jgi:hypothetical protein
MWPGHGFLPQERCPLKFQDSLRLSALIELHGWWQHDGHQLAFHQVTEEGPYVPRRLAFLQSQDALAADRLDLDGVRVPDARYLGIGISSGSPKASDLDRSSRRRWPRQAVNNDADLLNHIRTEEQIGSRSARLPHQHVLRLHIPMHYSAGGVDPEESAIGGARARGVLDDGVGLADAAQAASGDVGVLWPAGPAPACG